MSSQQDPKKERVSFAEYFALQQELEETKKKYGVEDEPKKEGHISRAISSFFERREAREKHLVSKKTYMRLMLLGIVGAHRFYAKHYGVAVFYLLTCWCGVSVAMTVIDAMVAIPMTPDENGCILL